MSKRDAERHRPVEIVYVRVGHAVRKARCRRGLTLRQVSNITGLTIAHISRLERADDRGQLHALYRIAHALGVTVFSFLPDDDAPDYVI